MHNTQDVPELTVDGTRIEGNGYVTESQTSGGIIANDSGGGGTVVVRNATLVDNFNGMVLTGIPATVENTVVTGSLVGIRSESSGLTVTGSALAGLGPRPVDDPQVPVGMGIVHNGEASTLTLDHSHISNFDLGVVTNDAGV